MPVQMFTDESGWKGQGTFIVMAGLIAESESWASFAATWQACLDERPRVSYFKAREAFNLKKQFYCWSKDARNGKGRDLIAVLNAHSPLMLFSAIELAPFEDTIARRSIKPSGPVRFASARPARPGASPGRPTGLQTIVAW
jgi:hypothetical protein